MRADALGNHICPRPRQEAQVALAGQLHIIKPPPFEADLAVVGPQQIALVAEQHIATHVDQVGVGVELRRGGQRGGIGQHRHRAGIGFLAGLCRREDAGQQQVWRRQVDPRTGRRVFTEVIAATVQAQALAHVQRHVTVETQQAVAEQRQVVKPAGADLVHAEAAMAVLEAGSRAGLMGLAEHQFTHLEHTVVDAGLEVIRAFQGQGQATARSTCATRAGNEAAVQVQAVVRRKADAAAIAGHRHAALAGNIQHRLGTGRVQARAVAHHHKQVTGLGDTGGQVDVAADADGAPIAHLAVDIATVAHRRDPTRRHVDQRVFTHPDRTAMAGGVGRFRARRRQAAQADAAAPGVEAAVHGQLADAAQVNGLAWVDSDHRALRHAQGCGGQFSRRGI